MIHFGVWVLMIACVHGILYASDQRCKEVIIINVSVNETLSTAVPESSRMSKLAVVSDLLLDPTLSIFGGGILGLAVGGAAGGIATIWVKNTFMNLPLMGMASGGFGVPVVLYTIGGMCYYVKKYS